MKKISQNLIVLIGSTVVALVILGVVSGFTSTVSVAEPQKIYVEELETALYRQKNIDGFIKASDMSPSSTAQFFYPDSANTENRDAFETFNLIRLPAYLGGATNDTSAFRAYSALDITSHCLTKYWPREGRDDKIEDPCQSPGYRILDGASIHPNMKSIRAPSTGVLPKLDLSVDDEGFLLVMPPVFTEDKNGSIGIGRIVSSQELQEVSEILWQYHIQSLPESAIVPLKMNSGHYLHYVDPEHLPRFVYYHDKSPQDMISLRIEPENFCHVDSWKPNHGLEQKSFGVLDKTIFYEIGNEGTHYRSWYDFCLDNNLYSIETNIPFEQMSQIILDEFIIHRDD